MTGKVVMITGACGILGSIHAERFAADGYIVVLLDLDPAQLESKKADMENKGYKVESYVFNVVDRQMWEDVTTDVVKKYGKVDVLVNNAAAKSKNFFDSFEEFPEGDWDQVMSVNVKGPVLGCQVVGSKMLSTGGGSIINILSIYGIVAPDQSIYEGSLYEGKEINTPCVYSASKASLWGITKYLAAYWGGKGIRVNAVTPGGVESGQNDVFRARYSKRVPMGRMANSNEMSGALLFLASDEASYITGQNIVVDGGLTVW